MIKDKYERLFTEIAIIIVVIIITVGGTFKYIEHKKTILEQEKNETERIFNDGVVFGYQETAKMITTTGRIPYMINNTIYFQPLDNITFNAQMELVKIINQKGIVPVMTQSGIQWTNITVICNAMR